MAIETWKDMSREIVRTTIMAIAVSEVLSFGLVYCQIGFASQVTLSAWAVAKIAFSGAFAIPAVLTPLMSYHLVRRHQEIENERRELQLLSITDPLTGLLNRRGFDSAAGEALEQAAACGEPVVAFHLDVDHFKRVNDHHGHAFGDSVLIRVGECLRRFAEENGAIVARFGGEEFVAVQFDATTAAAVQAAEALRRAIALRPIVVGRNRASITISVGIAGGAGATTSLTDLLERADDALYLAKKKGRDRVVVDNPLRRSSDMPGGATAA